MDDQTLVHGLKRAELTKINADLRERMAVVANDIEAVERVLDFDVGNRAGSPTARP